MQQITLTKGDYGAVLQVSFKDSSKAPINLTNCTVSVDIVKPDGVKTTKSVTITDSINGITSYTLASSDTDVVGNYSLYFYVTSTGYKITAQKVVNYYVKELNS